MHAGACSTALLPARCHMPMFPSSGAFYPFTVDADFIEGSIRASPALVRAEVAAAAAVPQ